MIRFDVTRASPDDLSEISAFDEAARGTGLGRGIVGAVIDKATHEGIENLALLTTTAKDFFESKFGFEVTNREYYGDTFDGSWEWNLPRCSSAVVMTKDLTI